MGEDNNTQVNDNNYVANRGLNELSRESGSPQNSSLLTQTQSVDSIPVVDIPQTEEIPPVDEVIPVDENTDSVNEEKVDEGNNNDFAHTIPIDPFVSSNMDTEETFEEPVIQKVIDVEEEKKNKILRIILISLAGVAGLIILVTLLVIILSPKKKESNVQRRVVEDASFSGIVSRSIRDGEFDSELEDALKDLSISTKKVYLIPMDLNSDENVELVAYVEENDKHYLLQFDVDEEVLFADSFPLQAKDTFGYVYSLSQNISNWCSVKDGQFTIIHHRKMVLKQEDFDKEYYIVTQDFNGKKVLENALEYEINGEFDTNKLDEITVTKETLLKSNNITSQDMRNKAEEYFKQKKEEEDKNNAESQKAKELEEQKNEIFGLNGVILRYGTYVQESGSYGNLTLNKNGSCTIGSIECKWNITNHDFNGDTQSIAIQFNDIDLYVSSWSSNNLTDKSGWSVMYQG